MVPLKKQDTNSSSQDLGEIKKQIQKLLKTTAKLQTNYKLLSKSVKDINKSIKKLTGTVENNKEYIDNHVLESEEPSENESPLSVTPIGERVKINRENFFPALYRILTELKETDDKEYVDIKTVKKRFVERHYLENESDFDQFLLESFWSNEIELISGISDYSVRDIYDNVYHYIKY